MCVIGHSMLADFGIQHHLLSVNYGLLILKRALALASISISGNPLSTGLCNSCSGCSSLCPFLCNSSHRSNFQLTLISFGPCQSPFCFFNEFSVHRNSDLEKWLGNI
uniref:4Fe-4S ferredoxin-type domain-containing protein n=1 Tax=Opuntia streptacantha TaxID=393608 RepID=A0A7C8ZFB4_OPUST